MCDDEDEGVELTMGHASQLTNKRGKASLPLGLQHAQNRANRPQTRKSGKRAATGLTGGKKSIPARPRKKKS